MEPCERMTPRMTPRMIPLAGILLTVAINSHRQHLIPFPVSSPSFAAVLRAFFDRGMASQVEVVAGNAPYTSSRIIQFNSIRPPNST